MEEPDPQAEESPTEDESFAERMASSFRKLFKNSHLSDMKVFTKDAFIPAHKFVFYAAGPDWVQLIIGTSLYDFEVDWRNFSSATVSSVLFYIYHGELEDDLTTEQVCGMYHLTMTYKLRDLLRICRNFIFEHLAIENSLQVFKFGELNDLIELKHASAEIIAREWPARESDFFQETDPCILASLIKCIAVTQNRNIVWEFVRFRNFEVFKIFCSKESPESMTMYASSRVSPRKLAVFEALLQEKNFDFAEIFIQNGWASIDHNYSGSGSSLDIAIMELERDVVGFLLKNKASVNSAHLNLLIETLARLNNYSDDEENVDVDDDLLPVSQSVTERNLNAVIIAKMLLGCRGVHANFQNRAGKTGLQLVLALDHLPLIKTIVNNRLTDFSNRGQVYCADHPMVMALNHPTFWKEVSLLMFEGVKEHLPIGPDLISILPFITAERKEDRIVQMVCCITKNNLNRKDRNGNTMFHFAAEANMPKVIGALLRCGADPNIISSGDVQLTPMQMAAKSLNKEAMHAFYVDRGGAITPADLNLPSPTGVTVLDFCVTCDGHLEETMQLVRRGATITNTMIIDAIVAGAIDTAKFLIHATTNFFEEAKRNDCGYSSPLVAAVAIENVELVKLICEKGMMPRCSDFSLAIEMESLDIAEILFQYNRIVFSKMATSKLHIAIDNKREHVAVWLAEHGADVNSCKFDSDGALLLDTEPLSMTLRNGMTAATIALITAGARVCPFDGIDGKTPLHVAIDQGNEDLLNFLLEHPSTDLSMNDSNGCPPFLYAIKKRNSRAAKAIRARAPLIVGEVNLQGFNALHMVLKNQDIEAVQLTLSLALNQDIANTCTQDGNGTPPLHIAALAGNETIIGTIVDLGGDLDGQDAFGRTALWLAVAHGKTEVVTLLMTLGAGIGIRDCEGNDVVHKACQEGHLSVLSLLVKESRHLSPHTNNDGYNYLHLLARNSKENKHLLCDLIMKAFHEFPIDERDAEGNTALLIAYKNGHRELCLTLARWGASVGKCNDKYDNIFAHNDASSDLFWDLLNSLTQCPPNADDIVCSDCERRFSLKVRRQHCRHCGRSLCPNCNEKSCAIPKFNLHEPQSVCDDCYAVLQNDS